MFVCMDVCVFIYVCMCVCVCMDSCMRVDLAFMNKSTNGVHEWDANRFQVSLISKSHEHVYIHTHTHTHTQAGNKRTGKNFPFMAATFGALLDTTAGLPVQRPHLIKSVGLF